MEGGPKGKLENTKCKRFYKHFEIMIQGRVMKTSKNKLPLTIQSI